MKRNEKIDVLRGWAIILVVFGHCMEYASGHEFFSVNGIYNNLIFKVIYSFHMPLFACISGWLFGRTIEKYASRCICTSFFSDNVGIYLLSIAGMLVIPDFVLHLLCCLVCIGLTHIFI